MRGVLYQCQDVGFLNTGVGLGYNTYANPFVCKAAAKQTVLQKYTGREFILPNMTFNDLPSYVNIRTEPRQAVQARLSVLRLLPDQRLVMLAMPPASR